MMDGPDQGCRLYRWGGRRAVRHDEDFPSSYRGCRSVIKRFADSTPPWMTQLTMALWRSRSDARKQLS